ncbi:hypothetical protein RHOSPDRAFT_26659 [Rhodotorula sp. JG-1b]|nr:hypothetical protein RHOSPDRAFT_26659 [Rhodotorula sp. JG-1b]
MTIVEAARPPARCFLLLCLRCRHHNAPKPIIPITSKTGNTVQRMVATRVDNEVLVVVVVAAVAIVLEEDRDVVDSAAAAAAVVAVVVRSGGGFKPTTISRKGNTGASGSKKEMTERRKHLSNCYLVRVIGSRHVYTSFDPGQILRSCRT